MRHSWEALTRIVSFLQSSLNSIIGKKILDSIYHMTIKQLVNCVFGVDESRLCHK